MSDEDDSTLHACPETSKFRADRVSAPRTEDGDYLFTEDFCHEMSGQSMCRSSCNYPFLFEWQCDMLQWVGADFGFVPLTKESHSTHGAHRLTEVDTLLGFLKSDDNIAVAWHSRLPNHDIPDPLLQAISNRRVVDHVYTGEQYLLTRCGDSLVAFDAQKYAELQSLRQSLDRYLHTPCEDLAVDIASGVLTIRTPWVWFALAAKAGDDYEEEERVSLSNRLEASHPFFEFKAPLNVDWQELHEPKDDNFQEIARLLLDRTPDIVDVIPIGKTRAGDRGRDFEVREQPKGVLETSVVTWLVQCKVSTRSIGPDAISGWTDRVREHGYDGYWLITNNDITSTLFDQFKDVSHNTGIRTRFWQRVDLHRKLNVYADILSDNSFFGAS